VRRRGPVSAACGVLGALLAASTASAAGPPGVERAAAAIVVDARDGAVLFQKDPRERRQIASATKLMTALLVLERTHVNDVFAAPAYRAMPAESRIDLRRGERMAVRDLLEALLLESANDAAVTLANGIAGSRPRFVDEMNRRADEIGLTGTSYANPIGLDDPDNYSTARDLARLSVRLMRRPEFARIVDMPKAVLESGSRRRVVANRNLLVRRHPFVDGIKTGHTLGAGFVLVGTADAPRRGRVVTVVLGEPSEAVRDADTLALLRWGLRQFERVRVLERGRVLARPRVEDHDRRARLVPRRGLTVTVRAGQRITRRVEAPERLEGPLSAGSRVGSVTVMRDGRPLRRVDLVTAAEVPGAGLLSKVGLPLTLLVALGILGAAVLLTLRARTRAG
jgi:D-alanyl-D-alanine carboxypeptidase (penicillin-binding protein 5/6)